MPLLSDANAVLLGSSPVDAVYARNTLVWPTDLRGGFGAVDLGYSQQPLNVIPPDGMTMTAVVDAYNLLTITLDGISGPVAIGTIEMPASPGENPHVYNGVDVSIYTGFWARAFATLSAPLNSPSDFQISLGWYFDDDVTDYVGGYFLARAPGEPVASLGGVTWDGTDTFISFASMGLTVGPVPLARWVVLLTNRGGALLRGPITMTLDLRRSTFVYE